MIKTFNPSELRQFTGSEHWYRHPINRAVLYTDGAQYIAETAGAYWLLDEIALAQRYVKAVAAEEFQTWTLTVRDDKTATLACDDGNGRILFTKKLEFTDFPAAGITLWCVNDTILLPSEY